MTSRPAGMTWTAPIAGFVFTLLGAVPGLAQGPGGVELRAGITRTANLATGFWVLDAQPTLARIGFCVSPRVEIEPAFGYVRTRGERLTSVAFHVILNTKNEWNELMPYLRGGAEWVGNGRSGYPGTLWVGTGLRLAASGSGGVYLETSLGTLVDSIHPPLETNLLRTEVGVTFFASARNKHR